MSPDELKEKQENRKFNLIVELKILQQRFNDSQADTKEFRKELIKKIDALVAKIEGLPCEKRAGWYEMTGLQLRALWVIVGVTLGTIIIEWFKK